MSAAVCPECAVGKCVNCCGEALDEGNDMIVNCACDCQRPTGEDAWLDDPPTAYDGLDADGNV